MDDKTIKFSRFFVRNCEFKFKCTQKWEELDIKEGFKDIKHCSVCQKDVHMVKNAWELVIAIDKNYCVAIPRTELITAKGIKSIGKPSMGHVAIKNIVPDKKLLEKD